MHAQRASHSMYYKVTLHVVSGVHVLDACFFPFNTRALTRFIFTQGIPNTAQWTLRSSGISWINLPCA